MNEFNIREQHAQNIYQAEKIYLGEAPKDHARLGIEALARRDYEAARSHLTAAAESDPGSPFLQYKLSLALLDGKRPHMNSSATIKNVERRLKLAERLPEALVLLVLVQEDYYMTWKSSRSVPNALIELINSVPLPNAHEIVEHVPAEQSRVWGLLAARARRDS